MEAGKVYPASLVDAGLTENNKGQVQPYMRFKIGEEEVSWFGNLGNEKGQEIAVKALVTAGFCGDDFEDLKQPLGICFKAKPVTVTIEEYNSKLRVKWVNAAKKEFKGAAPKLAQAFAKVRAELGIKKDDIPF